MPLLGAHLSAAGGVSRAVREAAALGCASLQLFQRPPGRWAAPLLPQAEVDRFRQGVVRAGIGGACFAHAPYLLNPASADPILRHRSLDVLVEELQRGGTLGLAGVVMHPGSAGGGSRPDAEARCRDALVEALERAGPGAARLLLEGTAGGGAQLGRTPEELARLAPAGGGVGICLDTAHLWGAGYDLTADGWDRVLDEVADTWGVAAPHLVHGNDTPVPLGSRRDRHAPPGDGVLGEGFYRRLLADARMAGVPLVLEIEHGPKLAGLRAALDRLRAWMGPAD